MFKFDSERRYQDCRFIERLYRRLKYQPICIVRAGFCTIKHLFIKDGCPKLVWQILSADWQCKAKWMYDWKEIWNESNLLEGIDDVSE